MSHPAGASAPSEAVPILRLRGVSQAYRHRRSDGWGWVSTRAADGVDLEVFEGQTLAVVGESGSGKSTLAKLLLMLATPTEGEVAFHGRPLRGLDKAGRQRLRREVQAVFQDPAASLNPRMTVERMLGYIVRRHGLAPPDGVRSLLSAQLDAVDLKPAQAFLARYPHQLSGGQQQRVAIARALLLRPKLIVADEPLSSLDVSVQAQILDLMRALRHSHNVGYVVISHDLGAMQAIADRTAVMYRGRIVELGPHVYHQALHPYTQLLLDARLSLDPAHGRIRARWQAEAAAQAAPPMAGDAAAGGASEPAAGGCRFLPRCPHAVARCGQEEPALRAVGPAGAFAACHRAEEWAVPGSLRFPEPVSFANPQPPRPEARQPDAQPRSLR